MKIYLPKGSIKEAQATGEAFSSQKRTSSTSIDENSVLFYFFGSFLPSWIRIRIRNLYADPDPDPTAQINADPCESGSGYGSGSETLVKKVSKICSKWLANLHRTFRRYLFLVLRQVFKWRRQVGNQQLRRDGRFQFRLLAAMLSTRSWTWTKKLIYSGEKENIFFMPYGFHPYLFHSGVRFLLRFIL